MRVLIAVDGTPHSVTVAHTANRLFGNDAEYLVLNVAQVPIGGWAAPYGAVSPMAVPMLPNEATGLWPLDVKGTTEAARSQAEEVATSSSIAGAEPIGDTGDPAMTIIDAAHAHQVDVIVIGHEDRSWFARLVEGSVSKNILRESDVPVLVVPCSEDKGHDDDKPAAS
jgi:nucleotide-binding universal stress UspA family protein